MMKKTVVATAVAAVMTLSACSDNKPATPEQSAAPAQASAQPAAPAATVSAENPLLKPSPLQYQAPQFDLIKTEHFLPAMLQGIAEHDKEITAIANNAEPATFENTIVAMEKSGELLGRATSVFFNLSGTDSTADIQKIQQEIAPKLAAHSDNINLNPTLFAWVKSIYDNRTNLNLDGESLRLVETVYEGFVRAGALLTDEQKTKIRALNEESSKLGTQFSQNLLQITKDIAVTVDDKAKLAGFSEAEITSAADAAKARGLEGK